ncbi:hypothetical protein NQ317_013702 [Molorchus minor]|uniref:Tubulin delta chain n=1 Tax=Molorchus minor TaxID=1323400 RepID=A0ABQ9JEU6_9CUCU|nr:hypothetical protein NQ317_013702 [Molorchus minor]
MASRKLQRHPRPDLWLWPGSNYLEDLLGDVPLATVRPFEGCGCNMMVLHLTMPFSYSVNKWFEVNKHGRWEPRSVLIDTENKAVEFSKPLPFKFKNVIAKSYGGAGNNWAYGYSRMGPLLQKEVLNVVRSEVEKCDYLTILLNLYSSSGGTGSGVGSFIIEQMRDEYPNKHIANVAVLPYVKGELVTQSFNSLLTLSHLYSLADSTILFENERLHYICKYTMGIDDVKFSNMNSIVAQQLASVFQPINNSDSVTLLNHLTSHPHYKYLCAKSEPHFYKENVKFEGNRDWKSLIATVCKQSRFDILHQKEKKFKNKVVSNCLITRGGDTMTESDMKLLKNSSLYVPWLRHRSQSAFNLASVFCENVRCSLFLGLCNPNQLKVIMACEEYCYYLNASSVHTYEILGLSENLRVNYFKEYMYIIHYSTSHSSAVSNSPSQYFELLRMTWSNEDKKKLLILLRRHGSSNMELIQQNMPHKTITEIRNICDKHSKLALNKWCMEENKNGHENQAVNDWLKVLKQINNSHRPSVQDIIPRVLKYIALYENRIEDPQINLSDCYLVLSSLSEGKAPKHLDDATNHFFFECLTKLAEALKYGETESYRSYLKGLKTFGVMEQKRKSKTLNPLNVPASSLKMTEVDKRIGILE